MRGQDRVRVPCHEAFFQSKVAYLMVSCRVTTDLLGTLTRPILLIGYAMS